MIGKSISPSDSYSFFITHHPCHRCASDIAQVSALIGITHIFYIKDSESEFEERWHESISIAKRIINMASIDLVGFDIKNLFSSDSKVFDHAQICC